MIKTIECFGPSGSGKTYNKKIIEKHLEEKGLKFYDYKKTILAFSKHELNLSLKEKLVLFYFKFIKFNFLKKISFFLNKNKKNEFVNSSINSSFGNNYKIYNQICNKIYKKFKTKNLKFVNFVNKSIEESNFNSKTKNVFKNWFIQECAGKYLSHKHGKKFDVLLDSEGFIQRINIYAYTKKNKTKIIQNYLKLCPLPDILIISRARKSIKKKYVKKELTISLKEQLTIYKKTLSILKKKNNLKIMNKSLSKKISKFI